MSDEIMTCNERTQPASCGLSRRDFLKLTAAAGGAAALLGGSSAYQRLMAAQAAAGAYPLAEAENQLYTVCLQCNTGCGIKVKLLDGVAAKIDGNPYSPWNMWPHIPYNTPQYPTGASQRAARHDLPSWPI